MNAAHAQGRTPAARRWQTGAATLVVVMTLFFVMALVAAYASKNQIAELRIASNYQRAGVAFELADAGLEWTLATLNGGNVDASCKAVAGGGSGSGSGSTWRQRLLSIDPSTRTITSKQTGNFAAVCTKSSGGQWACQCPEGGVSDVSAAVPVSEAQPSFGVALGGSVVSHGLLSVDTYGCSDHQTLACRDNDAGTMLPQGLSAVHTQSTLALLPALVQPPPAPLLLRGALSGDMAGLGLHNSAPETAGTLVASGAPLPAVLPSRIDTLPGVLPQQAMIGGDPELSATPDPDALFRRFLGMAPSAYRKHPALQVLSCASACGAAVRDAYLAGARMIWIGSATRLDGDIEVGSNADPLLVVIDGNATLNGAYHLHGLLYVRGDMDWSNASANAATLEGALIAEGSAHFSGVIDLWYQSLALQTLVNAAGSFVRVPGSWMDADK